MRDFVIHLTHRPGELANATNALSLQGVNIKSVAVVTLGNQGVLRLIPDDAEAARNALRDMVRDRLEALEPAEGRAAAALQGHRHQGVRAARAAQDRDHVLPVPGATGLQPLLRRGRGGRRRVPRGDEPLGPLEPAGPVLLREQPLRDGNVARDVGIRDRPRPQGIRLRDLRLGGRRQVDILSRETRR